MSVRVLEVDTAPAVATIDLARMMLEWIGPVREPALLKLWFEKVLTFGWAWGPGGDALRGKRCLWVVTTGGDENDYQPDGLHGHVFDAFAPVMQQTARFCGMEWVEPVVVHEARQLDPDTLAAWAAAYRARLVELSRWEPLVDA
jgi:glutathione-regulated potassium-efflux system ancillary protein KefF